MSDILFQLTQYQENRIPFVLCIVTFSQGSTPRKAGSRMLVFEDGSIVGTIGGGSVELQAKKDALSVMQNGNPKTIHYKLEEDLAMQCGGNMSVYFEAFFPAPTLYIFGAGHVGRALGFYSASLGFSVSYIDHRPDIYKEFDAGNANCLCGDYLKVADELQLNNQSYVVICTPSHSFDEVVLGYMAKQDLKYLGMMGSKRKVAEVSKHLLDQRVLTEDQLKKVDMPIGIPINVETPAEIAISILGKMIDLKNHSNPK